MGMSEKVTQSTMAPDDAQESKSRESQEGATQRPPPRQILIPVQQMDGMKFSEICTPGYVGGGWVEYWVEKKNREVEYI